MFGKPKTEKAENKPKFFNLLDVQKFHRALTCQAILSILLHPENRNGLSAQAIKNRFTVAYDTSLSPSQLYEPLKLLSDGDENRDNAGIGFIKKNKDGRVYIINVDKLDEIKAFLHYVQYPVNQMIKSIEIGLDGIEDIRRSSNGN